LGLLTPCNPRGFPFIAQNVFITVLLTNLPQKFDQTNVTVRIEAPQSGHVLTSVGANVKPPEEFSFPQGFVMQLPFLVPQFVIQEPATYSVVVLVDNETVGKRPFVVAALQIPPHQAH
jgi:Family of unknown function (DUF6941)